jgi:hypothetical protein
MAFQRIRALEEENRLLQVRDRSRAEELIRLRQEAEKLKATAALELPKPVPLEAGKLAIFLKGHSGCYPLVHISSLLRDACSERVLGLCELAGRRCLLPEEAKLVREEVKANCAWSRFSAWYEGERELPEMAYWTQRKNTDCVLTKEQASAQIRSLFGLPEKAKLHLLDGAPVSAQFSWPTAVVAEEKQETELFGTSSGSSGSSSSSSNNNNSKYAGPVLVLLHNSPADIELRGYVALLRHLARRRVDRTILAYLKQRHDKEHKSGALVELQLVACIARAPTNK